MSEGKRVRFFSKEVDDFGHPIVYRAYYVRGREANPGESHSGWGVAKVYALSPVDAPVPSNTTSTAAGGAVGAIAKAIVGLKSLNGDDFIMRVSSLDD